jgi:Protein of unknown function (DUF2442)
MYLAVTDVKPLDNYRLLLTFENQEKRVFNVTPFLDRGKYSELKEQEVFTSVHTCFDSIQWSNQLDFDPEFLYEQSELVEN